MVVSRPEQESPRQQHNHGSGTFVGGHNYGRIEMVDTQTKAVLAKLSREAPALGELLSKALRDGVISPEAVFAIESAARSINLDVAQSLWMASQRINGDVAELLMRAGERINPDVADQISFATQGLKETADKIENALGRLDRTFGVLNSGSSDAAEWAQAAEAMDVAAQNITFAAQTHTRRPGEWSWNSFRWGMVACLAAVITLLVLWTFAFPK
jgi:hypothetical protein